MQLLPPIRILILASSALARAGISALLNDAAQDARTVEVVGAHSGDENLGDVIDVYQPEVIVVDAGFDVSVWEDRIQEIHEFAIPMLLLLGDTSQQEECIALMRSGVRGILFQDTEPDKWIQALAMINDGFVVVHHDMIPNFIEATIPLGDLPTLTEALTPREQEVLNLVAEGLPNKMIGLRLNISEHTVKFHVNAILTKLQAQSRTDAVVRATRLGLLSF